MFIILLICVVNDVVHNNESLIITTKSNFAPTMMLTYFGFIVCHISPSQNVALSQTKPSRNNLSRCDTD